MSTTEIKSMVYLNFMTQAFRLDKRIRRPNKEEFKSLVKLEVNNENIYKNLDVLKNRMLKACEIFLNQNLTHEKQEKFNILMSLIAQADSSEMIFNCAKIGKSITGEH
jgi:hypothetical protein